MAVPQQILVSIFDITLPARKAKLFAFAVLAALLAVVPAAQVHAQTFQVIHNFTGGADGALPLAGLTADRAGNLYGTASGGGTGLVCPGYGCGTAFRLKHSGSGWIFESLYQFQAGPDDGYYPAARMLLAPNGVLYGTTYAGGINNGSCGGPCGTAFQLTPPPSFCKSTVCPWNESVIYRFQGTPDTGKPTSGPLVIDQAGNLYGSSINSGCCDYGDVYELSRSGSGWTDTLIYDRFFDGGPQSGLVMDHAGNFYGAQRDAGYGGIIYQLSTSGSGWQFHQLVNLDNITNGGDAPQGTMIADNAGNLYGTTLTGGTGGGGTVFKLSAGTWNFSVLNSFSGNFGSQESLTMDAAGNLYGTTYEDGAYDRGSVFKLTPSAGGWTYTDLYDFTGGSDGEAPISNVVIDAQGNLYGTASLGGTGTNCYQGTTYGCGVVWKITNQ